MEVDLSIAGAGGVLQAFVAGVLLRQSSLRPTAGLPWLIAAFTLGAFSNLVMCLVPGVRIDSSHDPVMQLAGAAGLGAMVAAVVGVRHYAAGETRGSYWEAPAVLTVFVILYAALSVVRDHASAGTGAAAILFVYMTSLLGLAARRQSGTGYGLAAAMFACYVLLVVGATLVGMPQIRVRLWAAFPFGLAGLGIMTASLERMNIELTAQLEGRKKAEAALAAMNVNLERRVAERTSELQDLVLGLESFSGMVSHDLRGPLGGIAGLAELAQEAVGAGESSTHNYLGMIRSEASRLAVLVSDLLTLARVSKAPLNLAPTDMYQVANCAIEALRLQSPGASMSRIDIGPLPTLDADAGLWQQVFVNLFSNAVKFTGHVAEPRIFLTAKNIGNEFVFELSDNGAGFSPESGDGLFQPFQRLHCRSFPGTGLGLTIVRRIVERHGGRVWAHGEVGSGARFFLGLPVHPPVQQSMNE